MHEEFKKKFKELDLKLADVEAKIECPENYLSRFINGPKDLPPKWEKKIRSFVEGIEKELAAMPVKNPDLLRPWIKIIEEYCLSVGLDPEGLIEAHKKYVALLKKSPLTIQTGQESSKEVKVQDLSAPPASSNYTVNTLSNWAEENRKKKLGLK